MRRTEVGYALLAAAVTLAVGALPANAAVTRWAMANEFPATSIHAGGDRYFARTLREKSRGRIEVRLHFGASLGYKSGGQFDAVGGGAIPIANTYVAPLGGIDPMFLLPSLPFLTATTEEAQILFEVARPYYDAIFEANNQKLLYASPWPPPGIWAKKPVDGVAVLKNLNIRTYDANGTIALKEAGAAPIQMIWADVVPGLGAGSIESVLTSAEGGVSARLWEHVNHFTEINYTMPLNMAHISLDTFNGLSKELRQAVLDSAAQTAARNWKALDERRADNYAKMKANGVIVVQGVSAEYMKALSVAGQKALDTWLAKTGDDGAAVIAEYKKRTGK